MLTGQRYHSSVGKESACNSGGLGLTPGSGRSSGEGNGNSLQHSCLENPMDRGALRATVHGVARVGHNLATKERETEFNKNIANNMQKTYDMFTFLIRCQKFPQASEDYTEYAKYETPFLRIQPLLIKQMLWELQSSPFCNSGK